jgi:hypothetical protein
VVKLKSSQVQLPASAKEYCRTRDMTPAFVDSDKFNRPKRKDQQVPNNNNKRHLSPF